MPKHTHSAKKASSRGVQIQRSNGLQSGLYFYLLDNKDVKELQQFLKSQDITLAFSNPQRNQGRYAIFLNFSDSSFTYSLFPGVKRCHITIDQDYFEFETGNPDYLRWHYAHYTEEYPDAGYTLHCYFNSVGKLIEKCITRIDGGKTTLPLQPDQEKEVVWSIEHASEVIYELTKLKRQACDAAVNKVYTMGQNLLSRITSDKAPNEALIEQLETQRTQIEEQRTLAQRYADNLLLFNSEYIADQIAKFKASKVDEELAQPPPATPLKLDQLTSQIETLNLENQNDALLQRYADKLQEILTTSNPLTYFYDAQNIKMDLIFLT